VAAGGEVLNALASGLPSRNGWSIAEHAGDRPPDAAQRLLNRASRDEGAAMSQVSRHAVAGLDQAARRSRRAGMTAGALDETGQERQGSAMYLPGSVKRPSASGEFFVSLRWRQDGRQRA
jgi:hypothetical protein